MNVRPHDLVWLNQANAWIVPEGEVLPDWVVTQWNIALPVVVRRDQVMDGFIPVGIRGVKRSQRFATKVHESHIVRVVTPDQLVAQFLLDAHADKQPVALRHTLLGLIAQQLPWEWGVTGSYGYQLATGERIITDTSDLDMVIRCPHQPASEEDFIALSEFVKSLPSRVDIQVDTTHGGFVLTEWLRDHKVLLKTNTGPIFTTNPWTLENVEAVGK